ncbi:hypothetical protein KC368_g72 [Hortaea werneckii]|nr:hypothetical protein KC368_g72 [Hortaea werneckii]
MAGRAAVWQRTTQVVTNFTPAARLATPTPSPTHDRAPVFLASEPNWSIYLCVLSQPKSMQSRPWDWVHIRLPSKDLPRSS